MVKSSKRGRGPKAVKKQQKVATKWPVAYAHFLLAHPNLWPTRAGCGIKMGSDQRCLVITRTRHAFLPTKWPALRLSWLTISNSTGSGLAAAICCNQASLGIGWDNVVCNVVLGLGLSFVLWDRRKLKQKLSQLSLGEVVILFTGRIFVSWRLQRTINK